MATQARRGLIWRAAWLVAVAVVVVLWRAAGGGSTYVVQIEFGMAPDFLTGAEVVVDGNVVGTLERYRRRTLNGFEVSEGDHTVEVRKDGCPGEPTRVTAGFGGTVVRLMAEPGERYDREREVYDCVIRLTP